MKRLFCLLLLLPINTMAEPLTAARQSELRNMLKHDCGACHGMTLKGGLGPSLLPEAIKDKSDDFLINTLLNGRKGTAMPPWGKFINPNEAAWLLQQIRQYK